MFYSDKRHISAFIAVLNAHAHDRLHLNKRYFCAVCVIPVGIAVMIDYEIIIEVGLP